MKTRKTKPYIREEGKMRIFVPPEPSAPKKDHAADNIEPSHYDMPITPVEFILKNNIPFCEGNVIKYVCRHKKKNGIEDLWKARHYIDILITAYLEEE